MKTLSHYIILILMIFTNACQYNQDSSPEHILNKSGITKDTYRNLSLCQRLDIVIDIGYDYIDRGHYSVVVPGWLLEGLSSPVDSDNLLKCADTAYKNILSSENNDTQKEKTTTLIYLMIELNLDDESIVKNIFHSSICEVGLIDDIVLLRAYYYSMNLSFPEDTIKPAMFINLICSKN